MTGDGAADRHSEPKPRAALSRVDRVRAAAMRIEPGLAAALQPADGVLDELHRRLSSCVEATADDFDFTVHVATATIAARGS